MNFKNIPSIKGAEVGSHFDLYDDFMKSQKEWNKKHDEFAKEQAKFDQEIIELSTNISKKTVEQHKTVLIVQTINSIAIILLAIALILRW